MDDKNILRGKSGDGEFDSGKVKSCGQWLSMYTLSLLNRWYLTLKLLKKNQSIVHIFDTV